MGEGWLTKVENNKCFYFKTSQNLQDGNVCIYGLYKMRRMKFAVRSHLSSICYALGSERSASHELILM